MTEHDMSNRRRWQGGAGLALVTAIAIGAAMPAARAQQTLDGLYQAAKAANETDVVIYGPPSASLRREFEETFGRRFSDIKLGYTGMAGSAAAAKLAAEERAGVNAADLIINGTTSAIRVLKPQKLIKPFEDLIVVADARDPDKWLGGLGWSDEDHSVLAMLAIVTPCCFANADLVKPGELTRDADLLNPKWKGKIVSNDPTSPGSANADFWRMYELHGADFIRKLVKDQEVVFVKPLHQTVDWVAKGRYAIGIGSSPSLINSYIVKGVKTLSIDFNADWKDTGSLSAGFGGLMVTNRQAHPAAAKLFINWLLTQEGQMALSRGLEYPSRRVDVVNPNVPEYLKARKDKKYLPWYREDYINSPHQAEMRKLLISLGANAR